MADPTFEEAMKRLEEIVQTLEGGELDLDRSLAMFEEGIKLSRFCTRKLDEVEKRIEVLSKNAEGELEARPFAPPLNPEEEEGG